jgi:hypothetical protein
MTKIRINFIYSNLLFCCRCSLVQINCPIKGLRVNFFLCERGVDGNSLTGICKLIEEVAYLLLIKSRVKPAPQKLLPVQSGVLENKNDMLRRKGIRFLMNVSSWHFQKSNL